MTLLAVDLTAVIVAGIGALVSLASLAMTLLIKGKQNVISKQIDGMQDKLIVAEKSASKAEGKLEEQADKKQEGKAEVVDVKIVDQDKVIKVGIEKPK